MKVRDKWRPSLAVLIALVVGVLVLLPFVALTVARITSNQFVQQTEANLYAQAAIYSEVYGQAFQTHQSDPTFGMVLSSEQIEWLQRRWHPIDPVLNSGRSTIQSPRPDPKPSAAPRHPVHEALSDDLTLLAKAAQKSTLVGFLALDHQGRIIAASGMDRGSLRHVPEVASALAGDVASATRWREDEFNRHSLKSLSRDTKFRVYVAHPVRVADRVVGVIYLSRTPSNLNKYLLQQRGALLWLLAAVTLSAALIGVFLWRFLTRPLTQLQEQASRIAKGETEGSLPSYGVKELAGLGQSLMDMGAALQAKSAALETYTKHATHELKSPVTSIAGAAELLQGDPVSADRRVALATTIGKDAARMDQLLIRMREMVAGQTRFDPTPIQLSALHPQLNAVFDELEIKLEGDVDALLPIPKEGAEICLHHLLQNACEHDANAVLITYDNATREMRVEDNGTGISEANIAKIMTPFFTTKRSSGGTGMGLSITSEVASQFGGVVSAENISAGALIKFNFK